MKKILVFMLMVLVIGVPITSSYGEQGKTGISITKSLEQKGVEILDFISKTITETKDFVVAQAPDVIKQLLTYDILNEAMKIIFWCVFSIILLILYRTILYYYRKFRQEDLEKSNNMYDTRESTDVLQAFSVISFIFLLASIITSCYITCESTIKLVQINTTPKAYLIHKFIDKK